MMTAVLYWCAFHAELIWDEVLAGVFNPRYPTWSLDIHSALTIGAATYSFFEFSLRDARFVGA
jgi:hypothetical protein